MGQQVDPKLIARAKELRKRITQEERLLWEQLQTNRLDGRHFRRQQVIGGLIVDFYCHAAGLVVEVDGPVHEMQADYDRERDAHLRGLGLHVLRVRNEEVREDLEGVLGRIRGLCGELAGN